MEDSVETDTPSLVAALSVSASTPLEEQSEVRFALLSCVISVFSQNGSTLTQIFVFRDVNSKLEPAFVYLRLLCSCGSPVPCDTVLHRDQGRAFSIFVSPSSTVRGRMNSVTSLTGSEKSIR